MVRGHAEGAGVRPAAHSLPPRLTQGPPRQRGLGVCGLEPGGATPCCAFPLLCTDRNALRRWPSSQPITFFPFSPKPSIHARMLHPWSSGPPLWSECTGWEPGAGSEATAAHLSAGEIVVRLCVPETAGRVTPILNPERLSNPNRLFVPFGPFTWEVITNQHWSSTF